MVWIYKPTMIKLSEVAKDIACDEVKYQWVIDYFHERFDIGNGDVCWINIPKTQEELDEENVLFGKLILEAMWWDNSLKFGSRFILEG